MPLSGRAASHSPAFKVIKAVKIICRGRISKGISAKRNYFIRNQHRMCYQEISDHGLPIGSGAMKSGIRRVVNLHMKGAWIYWLEKTAKAMLIPRSYYKSGRWNLRFKKAFKQPYIKIDTEIKS